MFIGSYPGENGRRGVDPQVLSSGYLDSVLSVGAFIDNHNQAEGILFLAGFGVRRATQLLGFSASLCGGLVRRKAEVDEIPVRHVESTCHQPPPPFQLQKPDSDTEVNVANIRASDPVAVSFAC